MPLPGKRSNSRVTASDQGFLKMFKASHLHPQGAPLRQLLATEYVRDAARNKQLCGEVRQHNPNA